MEATGRTPIPGSQPFVRRDVAAGAAGFRGDERLVGSGLSSVVERWVERIAPCPWPAHAGLHASRSAVSARSSKSLGGLYTPEERARRDASPWTRVQAVLAPLQFLVCAVSLALIVRYLVTGHGYAVAVGSVLLKTVALYAIMVTGSIWEKAVFGKWLFAKAFFWEDVFSFAVLALQTAYVACLFTGFGAPRQQLMIAVAAYAAYAINASQFLLKLRAARLEGASAHGPALAA